MEANSFEQPAFNLVVAETQLIYELTTRMAYCSPQRLDWSIVRPLRPPWLRWR